jgi:predicted secreted protein
MTAVLLKEQIAPNTYQTIAGLKVAYEDIDDGHIHLVANGIFTGTRAENDAIDLALSRAKRSFELSFETGRVTRGKFRIATLRYRGTHNGERNYEIGLVGRAA